MNGVFENGINGHAESEINGHIENEVNGQIENGINGHFENYDRSKGFVDFIQRYKRIVWNKKDKNTRLEKFKKEVEKKYNVTFETYVEFHEWSIKNFEKFYEALWHYFGVIHSKPYQKVIRRGSNILDNEWFVGAKMNYAENLLKYRDNRLAMICLDEDGNEETVTYAEMYNQVRLYAAALRKHGLKQGDRVACYMSHRKEAVFAMLAAASIGAVFGGPNPFFGAKAAHNIVNMMKPTFLFSVDRMPYNQTEICPMDNLPQIVNGVDSLKKIIIVPTKAKTLLKDISEIKNSCFLDEFLAHGKKADDTVPELVFEQLPFNHPISINFTSGTTGLPKAVVHCAGSFLVLIKDFGLHCNIDRNDIALSLIPVGWNVWFEFASHFALGNTMILYDGNPIFLQPPLMPFWDLVEKYKISFMLLETSTTDKMEKQNIVPRPNCNLDSLRMITICASPVKLQNIEFFYKRVKKDIFVASFYGATESLGIFSGYDMNLPLYSAEIQVPALGVDVKCYDDDGKPVIGQIGELVIATPSPALPIATWNDSKKRTLKELYLSKFPDVFALNDKGWINPKTKGFLVIGRSDDVIKQDVERFEPQDIYMAIHGIDELVDSLCVSQTSENGDQRAVLFVRLKDGLTLKGKILEKIIQKIENELSAFHVPEVILQIKDVPYNYNGKKMEKLVRSMIATNEVPRVLNVKNPQCLSSFCNIPELQNY